MQTETDIINLIKSVVLSDHRIRAAYIKGSRANSRISKDSKFFKELLSSEIIEGI